MSGRRSHQLRFVERDSLQFLHHGGIADLEVVPEQGPGDLGVEYISWNQVEIVMKDFNVLKASVQNTDFVGPSQPLHQGGQIKFGLGVDQGVLDAIRDLDQTEFRVVGANAQEFGVQREPGRVRNGIEELLQGILAADPRPPWNCYLAHGRTV